MLLVVAAALLVVQPVSSPRRRAEPAAMDDLLRRRIDAWIARNRLNPYGDPADTMYTGGTPLFNERTGATQDRYAYILERHPELKDDGPGKR
jgi:hypothetical protein